MRSASLERDMGKGREKTATLFIGIAWEAADIFFPAFRSRDKMYHFQGQMGSRLRK